MASFFGEIPELSSRAVDDEEVDNQPKFSIHLEMLDNQAVFESPCKTGVFAVGEASSAFVKSYLLPDNAVAIAKIKCLRTHTDDPSEIKKSAGSFFSRDGRSIAAIFFLDPNTLIFEISGDTPDEVSSSLCNLLYQNFCCDLAAILTTVHIASYKSQKPDLSLQLQFLKSLSTSTFSDQFVCNLTKLETPNFVSGFPAALLSKLEVRKKPALCIINYVHTSFIDFINSELYTELFEVPSFMNLRANVDGRGRLRQLWREAHRKASNMYI